MLSIRRPSRPTPLISKYVELPVAAPPQAKLAFAMLVARSQDLGPRTPDELIVTVGPRYDRLFVVTAPANAKIDPMPACQRIWRGPAQRRQGPRSLRGVGLKDDKLFEQSTQIEEEGDAAFHRASRSGQKPEFVAALTRQAQTLIDRLPAK